MVGIGVLSNTVHWFGGSLGGFGCDFPGVGDLDNTCYGAG